MITGKKMDQLKVHPLFKYAKIITQTHPHNLLSLAAEGERRVGDMSSMEQFNVCFTDNTYRFFLFLFF